MVFRAALDRRYDLGARQSLVQHGAPGDEAGGIDSAPQQIPMDLLDETLVGSADIIGEVARESEAIETLAGAPRQALPFLRARLRTVQPAAVEKRIALLITQLDDKDVSVCERATRELEKLGLPRRRATWSARSSLPFSSSHALNC